MTQDELKQAVAKCSASITGRWGTRRVGTGRRPAVLLRHWPASHRITGAAASSEDTRRRLEGHGIKVFDLNEITDLPVLSTGPTFRSTKCI